MSGQTTRMGGISFTIPTGYEIDPEKVYRMWNDFFERHMGTSIVLPVGAKVEVLPDPRIARDRARAEIDVVLREDARRFPAFATARRAAVLAHIEADPERADVGAVVVAVWIDSLHRYERERGGLREPSAKVRREWMMDKPMMVHYERNRGAR